MLAIVWRLIRTLLLMLATLVAGYGLGAVAGALIPVNAAWHQAASGVRVYVIDNGVHTDLVLPVTAEGVDWRDLVKPVDLADPAQAARSHLSFGWGNRDFYLNTPSWSAISPRLAFGALFGGGRTVLHVAHLAEPRVGPHIRSVILGPDEYRRLAAYVRATFAEGPSMHGYGGDDAFYEARGGYNAVDTCNQWTAGALRAAGVKMGFWTPLPVGVMRWL